MIRSKTFLALVMTGMISVSALAQDKAAGRKGGTNGGGAGNIAALVLDWCVSAKEILEEAKSNATEFVVDGLFAKARESLVNGLREALESQEITSRDSLSYRSVERGLKVATAIEEVLEGGQPSCQNTCALPHSHQRAEEEEAAGRSTTDETIFITLLHYYDLADFAMRHVDRNQFNPLHCRDCSPRDSSEYELRWIEYARRQLGWLTGPEFILGSTETGVIPRRSIKVYLKVAELMTSYAAEDLREPLFETKFACIANRLDRLSNLIAQFNSGTGDAWGGNEKRALNSVYGRLNEISNEIAKGCLE